jgi:predicted amidohydrolase
MFRVAGVQMDVSFAQPAANLQNMIRWVAHAAAQQVDLVVFPECALTGYCFQTLEEALPVAEPLDGPSVQAMIAACREHQVHAVFGLLEKVDNKIFNALALVGPEGLGGSYRKIHMPSLGVDRFATPGDRPFAIHQVGEAKIGMNICYDCSFPESARCLALAGADIIVLPTNWPPGAGCTADIVPNARALENHVYFISVDRIGHERGFDFVGKSKICHPTGTDIRFENHANEAFFFADLDLSIARNKRLVRVPNEHEIHRFNDRRPEMYEVIAEPRTNR